MSHTKHLFHCLARTRLLSTIYSNSVQMKMSVKAQCANYKFSKVIGLKHSAYSTCLSSHQVTTSHLIMQITSIAVWIRHRKSSFRNWNSQSSMVSQLPECPSETPTKHLSMMLSMPQTFKSFLTSRLPSLINSRPLFILPSRMMVTTIGGEDHQKSDRDHRSTINRKRRSRSPINDHFWKVIAINDQFFSINKFRELECHFKIVKILNRMKFFFHSIKKIVNTISEVRKIVILTKRQFWTKIPEFWHLLQIWMG